MKRLPVWLALVLVSACATLFNADRDPVSFGSEPTGAEVWIDGTNRGRTPLTLELQPNREYQVVLKLHGEERAFELTNSVGAGWIVLDVLGGLIPVIIDAATGEWKELDTKAINATF